MPIPASQLDRAAFFAFLVAALPASAGPLAPTKPSQLVTARALGTDCPFDDGEPSSSAKLIDSMTTIEGTSQPFVIPPKQALVITGVHILAGGAPDTTVGMNLLVLNGPGVAVLIERSGRTDAGGNVTIDVTLPTGLPVRAGNQLCVASSLVGVGGSVTGFFVKDK
jgi:hypothetical protein